MLPRGKDAFVIRTDFRDDAAWNDICIAIHAPVGPFRANLTCVSDQRFDEIAIESLVELVSGESDPTYVFVVDGRALSLPDRPVLVLDLFDEPGRTFRVVPALMASVENNLSLGNMDFADFAQAVDAEGVFRGFC